jgi:hypothetical protein
MPRYYNKTRMEVAVGLADGKVVSIPAKSSLELPVSSGLSIELSSLVKQGVLIQAPSSPTPIQVQPYTPVTTVFPVGTPLKKPEPLPEIETVPVAEEAVEVAPESVEVAEAVEAEAVEEVLPEPEPEVVPEVVPEVTAPVEEVEALKTVRAATGTKKPGKRA